MFIFWPQTGDSRRRARALNYFPTHLLPFSSDVHPMLKENSEMNSSLEVIKVFSRFISKALIRLLIFFELKFIRTSDVIDFIQQFSDWDFGQLTFSSCLRKSNIHQILRRSNKLVRFQVTFLFKPDQT